jgi:hypothetical protein
LKPPSDVAVHVYGAVERKARHITIIIIIHILISIAMFAITRVRKNILSFLPQSSKLLRGAYVVAVKVTLLGSLVTHFRVILDKILAASDIDVSMVIIMNVPVRCVSW